MWVLFCTLPSLKPSRSIKYSLTCLHLKRPDITFTNHFLTVDIVQQVKSGITERNKVIKELYISPDIDKAVIGTLIKMGCERSLAHDCKTDAIVSFVKACYRPNFEIKSSVTNYLIGAAKNIWLTGVTKYKKEHTTENIPDETVDESIEDNLISNEKKQLLRQLLDRLDDTCKKVLTLWSINKRMKEIATSLRYKSEGMARKKKHQCLQRLYAIIAENPQIKNELRSLL